MSKTAFYFKTRKEFEKVYFFVEEVNQAARKKHKFGSKIIRVKSRYLGDPRADTDPKTVFIPYETPSKKKYIGVIVGNKHQMKRANIDPVVILDELGVRRVNHNDNGPRYKGEQSSQKTHLKSYEQFRKLVSIFDKQFGPGNWTIHGPKKMQNKLKGMGSDIDRDWGEGDRLRKQYPRGIPVKVVVNVPDIDVKKYIFKLALMV